MSIEPQKAPLLCARETNLPPGKPLPEGFTEGQCPGCGQKILVGPKARALVEEEPSLFVAHCLQCLGTGDHLLFVEVRFRDRYEEAMTEGLSVLSVPAPPGAAPTEKPPVDVPAAGGISCNQFMEMFMNSKPVDVTRGERAAFYGHAFRCARCVAIYAAAMVRCLGTVSPEELMRLEDEVREWTRADMRDPEFAAVFHGHKCQGG